MYREEILRREKERQPLVPYTGVFFQDFLIVEELPDRLANGIVNFQKVPKSGNLPCTNHDLADAPRGIYDRQAAALPDKALQLQARTRHSGVPPAGSCSYSVL